jgi:hypothetical protein
MRFSFLFLILVIIMSCQKAEKPSELKYFDLAGLMKTQIEWLNKNKPAVKKSILLGKDAENIQMDSLDWEKELALFVQADINKKAYVKSYAVREAGSEVEYVLNSGESLPVKTMKVLFDAEKEPQSVIITTETSNYLLNAKRKLELRLQGNQLKSYHIRSEQKLFVGDTENIEVSGEIISGQAIR